MMRAFSRTRITAAVATAAATALVVAPTASPTPPRLGAAQPTAVQLDLAASATPMGTASVAPLTVEPVAVTPPDPTQLRAARAAMQRLSPETSEAPEALAASAVVAPFNAASNTIDSVYEWAKGWVEYGVSLSQYVLQFIPLGYLIGDQVGIIYYNLVEPIADSVVYQLIDPIVNDPLNISSYVNGAIAVGQTTVAALVDTAVAEFYYFFGWLIPPLPPLPLAVTEVTDVTELTEVTDTTDLAAMKVEEDAPVDGDVVDPALEGALPAPAAAPEAVVEQVEFVEAAKVPEPTDVLGPITEPATEPLTVTEPAQPDPEPTEPVEPVDPATDLAPVAGPTKDVANGVAAQGQVRSGSQAIVVRADSPGGPTRVDAQHPARAEASSSASTAPAEDAAPTSPSAPTAATTPSAPTSTTGTDTEASAAPAADTAP